MESLNNFQAYGISWIGIRACHMILAHLPVKNMIIDYLLRKQATNTIVYPIVQSHAVQKGDAPAINTCL